MRIGRIGKKHGKEISEDFKIYLAGLHYWNFGQYVYCKKSLLDFDTSLEKHIVG